MAKNLHNMEQRGNVWYFRKSFNGKPYHERLSSDKKKAMKIRDDYLYELRHCGKLVSESAGAQGSGVDDTPLLGEVAQLWAQMREADIRQKQLKKSSMRD